VAVGAIGLAGARHCGRHDDLTRDGPPALWVQPRTLTSTVERFDVAVLGAGPAAPCASWPRSSTAPEFQSFCSTDLLSRFALPGTFPLWMKVEQGVCGFLLPGVIGIVNGRRLRSLREAERSSAGAAACHRRRIP
jgi:hypothetical protein